MRNRSTNILFLAGMLLVAFVPDAAAGEPEPTIVRPGASGTLIVPIENFAGSAGPLEQVEASITSTEGPDIITFKNVRCSTRAIMPGGTFDARFRYSVNEKASYTGNIFKVTVNVTMNTGLLVSLTGNEVEHTFMVGHFPRVLMTMPGAGEVVPADKIYNIQVWFNLLFPCLSHSHLLQNVGSYQQVPTFCNILGRHGQGLIEGSS